MKLTSLLKSTFLNDEAGIPVINSENEKTIISSNSDQL